MIGAEAGEVMAAVQTAILQSRIRLRDAILAHPTMPKGWARCLKRPVSIRRNRAAPTASRDCVACPARLARDHTG
jgi:hypothetical protein